MLAGTRDIAIIFLAVESVVIGILLAVLLLQIRKLIRMLQDEVKPMLESANDTVKNVQGTTRFVSDTVVSPLVTIKSYMAGTRQAVRTLFSFGRQVSQERRSGAYSDRTSQDLSGSGRTDAKASAVNDEEVL